MLTHNIDYFQCKLVNIPKITILLDHGYHPEHLRQELEKIINAAMIETTFVQAA